MANENDADILRVPTPPQRRLSRSSIDLRDLEQQQIQQHDRVIHTDSAPSVIALENFYFKSCSKKNKTENLSQQFNAKANFLDKPLDCFHMQTNNDSQKAAAIDTFTIQSDNEDLARFIEDNYQYFRKQNNLTASATATADTTTTKAMDKQNRSLQLQVCSDPDFFTLKNNNDCCDACNGNATIATNPVAPAAASAAAAAAVTVCETKIKNKKHKMAALSDSDFIVSFGSKSKKFTFKSKLPFKTMLNGKMPKALANTGNTMTTKDATTASAAAIGGASAVPLPNAYDVTDSTMVVANTQQIDAVKRKQAPLAHSHKGLNNNLSKSLNGCHRGKHVETTPLKSKSIQRVLSEGNETSLASHRITNSIINNETHQPNVNAQPFSASADKYDAFDMFVKLFHCEKNDKNSMLSDKQNNSKYSYKIVVNAKEFDYDYDLCDSILDNYSAIASNTNDNLHKLAVTANNDCAKSNVDMSSSSSSSAAAAAATATTTLTKIDAQSDQLVIVNHPYDEHLTFNFKADVGLHNSHVLVNNLVISSPPVTPKQLLSPKTINKEPVHPPPQPYFSYSHNHLSPNMLNADTTSIAMDMPDNRAPFEHLASLRATTTTATNINTGAISTTTAAPDTADYELKVPDISNVHTISARNVHNNGAMASEHNFIKNDLALPSNPRTKCDNFAGGLGPISNSRIRKPSVTYDINVINKSPDFNIDDICPQRNSYAARSGSTTSTSKSNQSIMFSIAYTTHPHIIQICEFTIYNTQYQCICKTVHNLYIYIYCVLLFICFFKFSTT